MKLQINGSHEALSLHPTGEWRLIACHVWPRSHGVKRTDCFSTLLDFISLFVSFPSSDSFVNSQEWTLSRSVPELKVVSGSFSNSPSIYFHLVFLNAKRLSMFGPRTRRRTAANSPRRVPARLLMRYASAWRRGVSDSSGPER